MEHPIAAWTRSEPADPRHARRQRQHDGLVAIRALPEAQQSRALWERWPQRVPKAVWRVLTGRERKGWQATAQLAVLMRRFACWPVYNPEDVRHRLRELAALARVMHGSALRHLLAPVLAHPGSQCLTVYYFVHGLMGPFNPKTASFVTQAALGPQGDWGDHREATLNALALGLLHGGTVVVRQELPLKSQRQDASGQWAWVPQERVMGATLCDPMVGEWCPQPALVMRQASQTDARTGQPCPLEPHWSFVAWPGAAVLR
jgi:hypothetical protein